MALTTTISLTAQRRSTFGKGPARQLRGRGLVPAVIYGRGRQSESLTVPLKEFEKAMTGVSGATLINLDIDGKSVTTLVREVQRHPFRPGVLHIDFLEIHEGETLTVDVPIYLVGAPEGVRTHGGVLDQVLREVVIEVLPKDMPDHVDLDVTDLGVGQSLNVSDLTIENATVMTDPKATICSVVPPRVEEEVAPEVEEVEEEEGAEPELIRKPKAEDEQTDESAEG